MWNEKWLQHPETHLLFIFKETFKREVSRLLLKVGAGHSDPDSQMCLRTYICSRISAVSAPEPLSDIRMHIQLTMLKLL